MVCGCCRNTIFAVPDRQIERMNLKSILAKPFASHIYKKIRKGMVTAVADQERIFKTILKTAKNTQFGRDHGFETIQTYDDFKKQVPVRDYEQLKPYIEKLKEGKENILWN